MGIAVASLGHCHPVLVEALKKQVETLWATSNLYKSHAAQRLAERLVGLTFADTVFFQNSGVEAWDTGIKIIRKYFTHIGQPNRTRIISFQGCFHGRSMTAIAASKAEKMAGGFGPLIDCFDQVDYGDTDAVRAAITPDTAAIMLEPILGEGGMKVASTEFLQALRKLCDEKGLLLYFDEIQCGMGRSGKLFAHEYAGVTPDVMCIAKALGNGFPIGACLATAKAAQGMMPGTHGSTYGGNPLAMAVGNAVLDVMTLPEFLPHVTRLGDYFERGLLDLIAKHPKIFSELRGRCLIRGLVCVVPNNDVVVALQKEKFLTVAASGNVVRLLPPLIVTEAQIDEAITILHRVAKPAKVENKTNELICPQVAILQPAQEIFDYGGENPDPAQLVARVKMQSIEGDCGYQKNGIDINFTLHLSALRGPRLGGDKFSMPFFIAIVDPSENIISRQTVTAQFHFAGSKTAMDDEALHVFIPLPEKDQLGGPDYRVLTGFKQRKD
jgi:acetylornithine/N-succinyldiaminopimelate aminotransferase